MSIVKISHKNLPNPKVKRGDIVTNTGVRPGTIFGVVFSTGANNMVAWSNGEVTLHTDHAKLFTGTLEVS